MKPIPAIALIGGLSCFAASSAFASGQRVFAFPPGDLEQWSQIVIPGGDSEDRRFFATNSTFGNRVSWADPSGNAGGVIVTSEDNIDTRDFAHNTAVLRSPSFTLDGLNPAADSDDFFPTEISFRLLAGMGSSTGPANFADLPAVTVNNAGNVAWLGVGLRRVDDDTYLLWGNRTSNAQGSSWQTITWDAATLAAAIEGDAPGTLYTLDLIDAAHGSWGWVAMDSLTMINENEVVYVSVEPFDVTGAESGGDQELSIRFLRTGNLSEPLEVIYMLEGTAFEYTDFEELPGYVGPDYHAVIPAGEESVEVVVRVIPNDTPEVDRWAGFRILDSGDYTIVPPSTAQLWISDLPSTGLVTASGPLPTGTFLPMANPFSEGVAGSLFFYGEANHAGGFLVLGIRGVPLDNSANGGVDVGRNNAAAGCAIFNYLDHKGAGSATARVPGDPEIPIQPGGRYTLIGEIEMREDNTGNLRAWIWDGQNGSLDFEEPHIVTPFSSGFTGLGKQIYLRLDGAGGPGTTWTNARAIWVQGTDATALEAAFHQLAPARPFLHVDASVAVAGEFGPVNEIVFSVSRSGPPDGTLEVPLEFFGTATEEDFSAAFPASVSFTDGESSVLITLEIAPDELYEGDEIIAIGLASTMDWLVPLTPFPAATVLDRPFQGWMASNLPDSQDGPEDDTDGDGWANVLEYFSGTRPNDPGSHSHTWPAPGGSAAALRFQRNPLASDVDAHVLWSTDLETWRRSGETDGSLTVTIIEEVAETSDLGLETVDARAEISRGSPARLFLRLAVELP